jgi:hypothetical protein
MVERLLSCLVAAAVLCGCAVPASSTPTPSPASVTETPASSSSSAPSASEAASASAAPAGPSASPQASVDAEGLEILGLELTGCPGGVALDWSPASSVAFHHYTALRSLEPDVATAYPPIAPAVDWGRSYVTDRFVTTAVDASLIPSEAVFYYRVMAYDVEGRPVAASGVVQSRPSEVIDLGPLAVEEGGDEDATRIDWQPFEGLQGCFSAYRLLIGPEGLAPSSTLTVISDQDVTGLETLSLHAGESYAIRIDAVRTTTLGSFVVARSETASYTPP